jgi:probable F420-dependent oxidoreductase
LKSSIQIGAVFPQVDLADDVGALRAWARGVEAFGYHHVMIYDHVVGADISIHKDWRGAYDVESPFHEPLVTFGYLAALTNLELFTGILILPQRQTVLVAKQAAEVDLLSGGRLRLGVGLGWNRLEYEALGENFGLRGKRLEEQVLLLRELWTNKSVTFQGEFDNLIGVGLVPLPIQRPIPLWIGCNSEVAFERAGRLGDGWISDRMVPGPELQAAKKSVERGAFDAGRDPATLGMQGRVRLVDSDWPSSGISGLVAQIEEWHRAGATHVAIDTMGAEVGPLEAHLEVLSACAETLGLTGTQSTAPNLNRGS